MILSFNLIQSSKGRLLPTSLRKVLHLGQVPKPDNDQAPKIYDIPHSNNLWALFVDGVSGENGARARILLTNPDEHYYTYALRFDFKASNNESEYVALIAGLQIPIKLGVQKIKVYSDSQLVVNQVLGTYVVEEVVLQHYLEKVKQLLLSFEEYLVDHVPRVLNKRANALNKLAYSVFAHHQESSG